MKKIIVLLPALTLLVLAACNGGKDKTPASGSEDTAKGTTATTAPAEFKPFDVVEITHKVKDYSKWKPAFDMDSTARNASGLGYITIGRAENDSNNLMVVLTVADRQKAKDFAASPRLKEVMEKNGVISAPEINYFHVIRFNPDSKEKQWVVVTHHVKDFATWLKVYDQEGTATRASFGLVDVAVAQGIDDPNLVHIVFDIKDMAKAKARMNDPALKKIMTDAGVEGPPSFQFFTNAQ